MSRTIVPDGVDYVLLGVKDVASDTQVVLLVSPGALVVAATAGGVAAGAGLPPHLVLCVAGGMFAVLSALALLVFQARWASDRRVAVELRSWGLTIDGLRVPWDALKAIEIDEGTFSLVTHAGVVTRFQDDGSIGSEIVDARARATRGQEVLAPEIRDAMHRLKRGVRA